MSNDASIKLNTQVHWPIRGGEQVHVRSCKSSHALLYILGLWLVNTGGIRPWELGCQIMLTFSMGVIRLTPVMECHLSLAIQPVRALWPLLSACDYLPGLWPPYLCGLWLDLELVTNVSQWFQCSFCPSAVQFGLLFSHWSILDCIVCIFIEFHLY